ncbi:hypothetical protein AYK26_07840 [Euryarchaeota archaeon SM23-78]|nr:MAG: hypothetical protein AYK26_07840 [Euryarchaeota archaeon SM23-78]MBW3001003.1 hypothetical protein [Candidatus Woesearchaeota archaeon]
MFVEVIKGVFSMANSFIAIFIVVYAFLFLKKTKSHKERRPWDYLVIASIIYLVYTMFSMLLNIYGIDLLIGLNLVELSIFFQFIYTGLILLAFISQTDLIFKNEIIIITRKLSPKEKEKIDVKIVKKKKEEEKKSGEKEDKSKVYIS